MGDTWKCLFKTYFVSHRARYLHACSVLPLGEDEESGEQLEGVIVAGGYSEDYLDEAEVLDPRIGVWMSTGALNVPRQGAQMAVLNGKPTIIGTVESI